MDALSDALTAPFSGRLFGMGLACQKGLDQALLCGS